MAVATLSFLTPLGALAALGRCSRRRRGAGRVGASAAAPRRARLVPAPWRTLGVAAAARSASAGLLGARSGPARAPDDRRTPSSGPSRRSSSSSTCPARCARRPRPCEPTRLERAPGHRRRCAAKPVPTFRRARGTHRPHAPVPLPDRSTRPASRRRFAVASPSDVAAAAARSHDRDDVRRARLARARRLLRPGVEPAHLRRSSRTARRGRYTAGDGRGRSGAGAGLPARRRSRVGSPASAIFAQDGESRPQYRPTKRRGRKSTRLADPSRGGNACDERRRSTRRQPLSARAAEAGPTERRGTTRETHALAPFLAAAALLVLLVAVTARLATARLRSGDTSVLPTLRPAVNRAVSRAARAARRRVSLLGRDRRPSSPPPAGSAQSVPPGDWPAFGRTPDNNRYSPLTQITPANVGPARRASTRSTSCGSIPDIRRGQQSYPLAIGGRLFVTTNDANVFAIDGATGRILWQCKPPNSARLQELRHRREPRARLLRRQALHRCSST